MVYVHIPFCESFCIYCDFYSELCSGHDKERKLFVSTLRDEILTRKEEIEATKGVDTLYIGGGTPSVMDPSDIREIVHSIGQRGYGEFTIEVNPEDIVKKGEDYVRALMDIGVNRFSMGVQSFDDGILRFMRRRHNSEGAVEAFRILRRCGAGNISIDLIFGLSLLSDEIWSHTVDSALGLGAEHVSAYQLSIEEGSALSSLEKEGKYVEATQEECGRQYEYLCRRLSEAGYNHYEISNFALPGYEAVHNSAYWKRLPYVGLGPGAHSFDGTVRSWNTQSLASYTRESERLGAKESRTEEIMLSLRTAEGMEEGRLKRCAGERGSVERLIGEGSLIRISGGRVRIPEEKFFVSDGIIRELI